MRNSDLSKSFKKFCPKCEYFQQETGVCKNFYFNVREYPKKFLKKCNGKYFKEDVTKTVQEIDEVEAIDEVDNNVEAVHTSQQYVTEDMSLGDILFSFDGRINRAKYWLSMLPLNLLWVIGLIIDMSSSGAFYWICSLIVIWPTLALNVKRCHDRDKSGWFYLVNFIPIVSLWYLVEIGFLKGTEGDNRFGQDPLGQVA